MDLLQKCKGRTFTCGLHGLDRRGTKRLRPPSLSERTCFKSTRHCLRVSWQCAPPWTAPSCSLALPSLRVRPRYAPDQRFLLGISKTYSSLQRLLSPNLCSQRHGAAGKLTESLPTVAGTGTSQEPLNTHTHPGPPPSHFHGHIILRFCRTKPSLQCSCVQVLSQGFACVCYPVVVLLSSVL